jgi:type I restriction enzyme M protein
MAIKKSDLYSSLWASCDELRGGMDASQYKDYVLFMLFIKYISDNAGVIGADSPSPRITSRADFVEKLGAWPDQQVGRHARCPRVGLLPAAHED